MTDQPDRQSTPAETWLEALHRARRDLAEEQRRIQQAQARVEQAGNIVTRLLAEEDAMLRQAPDAAKRCTKCNNVKPITDFRRKTNGNWHGWCANCKSTHARRRHLLSARRNA